MTAAGWNLRTTALIGFCLLLACARATPPPLLPAEPPREAAQSTPPAAEATPAPAPAATEIETETGTQTGTETEVPPEPRTAREDPEPPPPDGELTPIPARVRVGLATDLDSVAFPCCDQNVVAMVNGERLAAVASMLVEPAVTVTEPPVWRLQVAALRDETQAEDLARRLGAALAAETRVVFDAGTGLYRVRVGSFSSRAHAEEAQPGLAQRNIHDAWIVSEQPAVEDPAVRLTQGDRAWIVRGRWLAFESPEGRGVSALGRRYRGRILVYLNNRGTLNLINEVALDEYLRGVVPREMGPEIYDEIEALKAQAVAARSYTLRNMGEFSEEGYDICATPRCQVYGGMDAENPLSDRAVLETSGEVLAHLGGYADALYSSTCGGHTENVEVVFPLKEASYLRGVPCHEAGIERIEGALERGLPLEQGLSRVLAPPASPGRSATDFAVRLKMLASAAGLAPVGEALVTLERRELQRFLAAQLGLEADARLMVAA
jgi:cell division protein FtsN